MPYLVIHKDKDDDVTHVHHHHTKEGLLEALNKKEYHNDEDEIDIRKFVPETDTDDWCSDDVVIFEGDFVVPKEVTITKFKL